MFSQPGSGGVRSHRSSMSRPAQQGPVGSSAAMPYGAESAARTGTVYSRTNGSAAGPAPAAIGDGAPVVDGGAPIITRAIASTNGTKSSTGARRRPATVDNRPVRGARRRDAEDLMEPTGSLHGRACRKVSTEALSVRQRDASYTVETGMSSPAARNAAWRRLRGGSPPWDGASARHLRKSPPRDREPARAPASATPLRGTRCHGSRRDRPDWRALPLPLAGEGCFFARLPRVPLRSTRGYRPWPLRGRRRAHRAEGAGCMHMVPTEPRSVAASGRHGTRAHARSHAPPHPGDRATGGTPLTGFPSPIDQHPTSVPSVPSLSIPPRTPAPPPAAHSPRPFAMIVRWISDVPEYSVLPIASRISRSNGNSVM